MAVIRGEPVEVWLRDGRPARFVWRGRMYTVIFVVDRRPAPIAELAAGVGAELTEAAGAELDDAIQPAAISRECWLVEATPERTLPPNRYELCHDLASDRWSLSRG